jgi:hypothetical protein
MESAASFSFSNQPLQFYIGLSPDLLFSKPVRPNFPNQLLPIFYSETWGDYWNYFTVYAIDTRESRFVSGSTLSRIISEGNRPDWFKTNHDTISNYLGRVNLISIFPSALAFIGILFAAVQVARRTRNPLVLYPAELAVLPLLSVMTSLAGYLWFIIMHINLAEGDTIKATYVLQIFPFVALLVGCFLDYVCKRSRFLYWLIIGGLFMSFVHNIPAMLTHYSLPRLLMF